MRLKYLKLKFWKFYVRHYGFGQQGGNTWNFKLSLGRFDALCVFCLVNKGKHTIQTLGTQMSWEAPTLCVHSPTSGFVNRQKGWSTKWGKPESKGMVYLSKRMVNQLGTLKVLLGFPPLLTIPFSDFRLSPFLTIPFSDFRLSPLLTNPFSDFPRVDQNHSGQQGAGVRTQCIRYFPETV